LSQGEAGIEDMHSKNDNNASPQSHTKKRGKKGKKREIMFESKTMGKG
jgi:hypothetical protein